MYIQVNKTNILPYANSAYVFVYSKDLFIKLFPLRSVGPEPGIITARGGFSTF